MTANEARAEITKLKHELNSPKTTLFATKKAYKRISELWAVIDKEETDGQLQQQVTQTEKQ